MKTTIYTSFDCLLRSGEKDYELEKNAHISFDSLPPLFVYPVGRSGLIPYQLNPAEESPFYFSLEKDGQRLVFLLDGLSVQSSEIHSFSFEGLSSKVEISNQKIIFSTASASKTLSLPSGCHSFDCGNFYHINYVSFSSLQEQAVVFFNTKNNQTKIFFCENLSKEKDGFLLQSSSGSKTLFVDKEGLKIKNQTFSPAHNFCNPLLVASEFIKNVKDQNYLQAKTFLSSSLQNAQEENSLAEFFGDISFFFTINPKTIFTLSNGEGKLFRFEFEDGKICDIFDD